MVRQTDDLKLVRGLLIERCPICGREFSCNKSYHVYTSMIAHIPAISFDLIKKANDKLNFKNRSDING